MKTTTVYKFIGPTLLAALIILLIGQGCNSDKKEQTELLKNEPSPVVNFDKAKWNKKVGKDYPYREEMLDAVVYSDSIRMLDKEEILNLLGEPSYYRNDDQFLYYTINQKRLGSWPLHTKTMVVKLADDNSIEWIKVHE